MNPVLLDVMLNALYDIKDSNGKDVFDYGFCELMSVEDVDNSYKDIMHEWDHCFEED